MVIRSDLASLMKSINKNKLHNSCTISLTYRKGQMPPQKKNEFDLRKYEVNGMSSNQTLSDVT